MPNTVIALKKSATPSAAPTSLANGELALNFSDGKIFYKNAAGYIVEFKPTTSSNYFGTVDANGTLLVADTINDVLSITPGNNISIIGDAVNDKLTVALKDNVNISGTMVVAGDFTHSGGTFFINNSAGAGGSDEGGEIKFANSTGTQILSGPVSIDIYQNKLRFFETNSPNRGAFINIAACGTTVGTDLLASSGATDSLARATASQAFDKANNALANTNGITFGGTLNVSQNVAADKFIGLNNGNGENFKVGDDAWLGDTNLGNTVRLKGQQNTSHGYILFGPNDGKLLGRAGTDNLTYDGNTVWHAGTDGAGSGLDADLLDGQHGTYYGIASDVTAAFNKANSTTYNSNVVISVTDNTNAALRIVQSGNTGLIELSDTISDNIGQIRKDVTLSSWNLSGNSLSILAQDTTVTSIFMGNNGSSLYVLGTTGDRVSQFNLTTPWNVATGSNVGAFSVVTQDTGMNGLYIKPDGTQFYLTGLTADKVFSYSMSTPWDITTASYEGAQNTSATLTETNSTGIDFKPDGTKFWLVGTTDDRVYEYTLGTAWNVATATVGNSYSTAAFDATAHEIRLSSDGTKLWLIGITSDYITEHVLSTPWDISTASYRGKAVFLGTLDTNMTAMHVAEGVNKAYIAGQTSDRVYEFDINKTIEIDAKSLSTSGEFQVAGNTVIGRDFYLVGTSRFKGSAIFDNTLTVTSTATLSSLAVTTSVNFNGTTSTFNLGTALTTGTWTAGGPAMTGNMILGQSTLSQNVSIGIGATASNNTKYIQIGTNGLAGSNTAITIGSATSLINIAVLQSMNVSGNIVGNYIQGDGSLLTNLNLTPAYTQINVVYGHANAAFASANAGQATANAAFNVANSGFLHANSGYAFANSAHAIANLAFTHANAAFTQANVAPSAFIQANAARDHANAAFLKANTGGSGGGAVIDLDTRNVTNYIFFDDSTSGALANANVSTTLTYNPSTGTLSSTLFNSTSDENFKYDVKPIKNALGYIDGMNGVKFKWKNNDKPSLGVIAQEIERILPELVNNDGDHKTVNYNGIIAVLIQAIKELKTEVDDLKTKYGKLKE